MKCLTPPQITSIFKAADKDTIIRNLNLKLFCREAQVNHTVCDHYYLIDFNDLMQKLNPKQLSQSKTLPRLRTKKTAIKEWNAHHRRKIKHHIVDRFCSSGKVFVYKHGRHNIINYDELEKELIKYLRAIGKY